MKKNILIALFLVLGLAASFQQGSIAADEEVVVIVNKAQTPPSNAQLKQIFTGELATWPDGSAIKVLLNSDSGVYTNFANKYLNMSPRSIDSAWAKKKVKQGTPLPRKVNSTVVRMMVTNSPLFIGFVKKSEATGDLKIVE